MQSCRGARTYPSRHKTRGGVHPGQVPVYYSAQNNNKKNNSFNLVISAFTECFRKIGCQLITERATIELIAIKHNTQSHMSSYVFH